jgi:4-diphosphocytidyl-2-C-methyl-D-erythritol kinase
MSGTVGDAPTAGDPEDGSAGAGGGVRRLLAPAKLTVSLQVTGVRPDGYHELDAEMVTLSLADELELEAGGSGLAVTVTAGVRSEGLPGSGQNLVERALAACGRHAAVRLTKRIPVGGGLGGGSADAAAVLRWAGSADPDVAVRLGADVPFCVVGGRARVEGVGERVTPLAFEARDYLLVLPPFGVETARVYAAWDEAPGHEEPNALTSAALVVEPRLAAWRDALRELTGKEPVLAGSGSTWFVEGDPAAGGLGAGSPDALRVGAETGTLVRARTVPAGWDGD